jgi:hypothetical protein
MQTEAVRETASRIAQVAQMFDQAGDQLSSQINVLNWAWQAPGQTSFSRSLWDAGQRLKALGTELAQLGTRLGREVDEWEASAAGVAGGTGVFALSGFTVGNSVSLLSVPIVTEVAPLIYAIFSKLAYSNDLIMPDVLGNAGWESFGDVYSILGRSDNLEGYYGRVFINRETGQVVVAHRGTDNLKVPETWFGKESDMDDDSQLFLGVIPDQYKYSREFVDAIKAKLQLDPQLAHAHWVHTGHSLGGALADLNAVQDKVQAITFDNPGTQQIIQRNTYEFDGAGRSQLVDYRSNPSLVHLLGDPSGYSVQIIPAQDVKGVEILSNALNTAKNSVLDTSPMSLLFPQARPVEVVLETGQGFTQEIIHRAEVHHDLDNIISAMDSETGFPKGYFPPSGDDKSHGTYNLNDFQQGTVNGAVGGPECFDLPPIE